MPTIIAGKIISTDGFDLKNNKYRTISLDPGTHSLIEMQEEHSQVHAGKHYILNYSVADIGALTTPNDTMTLTWTTPNTTTEIHMVVGASGSSGARFLFIEGSTGGGASPTGSITINNNNRQSTNTSTLIDVAAVPAAGKISYDATVLTGGTSLLDMYIGAAGIITPVGGFYRDSQEWILAKNTKYQISLFTLANVPGTLSLNWYEIVDKD